MLEQAQPQVVHITTPPNSHYNLGMAALDAGAHVIMEKPAAPSISELEKLLGRAASARSHFIEDYNYIFNSAIQCILQLVRSGEFGSVLHVDVFIALDIFGAGGFADPNSPHPALSLSGGAIGDFLPHLASLAHAFLGRHRSAESLWSKRKDSILPFDEFRALVQTDMGTATLGFSANSQPDAFWIRVFGERMQATANLFETRLTFDRFKNVPKPLRPFISGFEEGTMVQRAAISTLLRKFKGPGAYEGLWTLLTRVYASLENGSPLPVTEKQVLEVNQMIESLKPKIAP